MHMYRTFLTFAIALMFLFFDWHARMVFIATVYPRRYGHGKTWKRAQKHYKENWSLLERILWLFAFKESYEGKHRAIAYLSYIHFFFTILTICCFLLCDIFFPNSKVWIYEFIAYAIFMFSRFIYNNAIGQGKI